MYDYIRGSLIQADPDRVVIDHQGLGYDILIPLSAYSQLPNIGKEATLYLNLVIREDSHRLFGFTNPGERDLFTKLITISGIGPKTALALIGHMPRQEFYNALANDGVARLSKIPGIGKKTAERLIIELRGYTPKADSPISTDVEAALINLGYSAANARKAAYKATDALGEKSDISSLITLALQQM
ncbi:MAG: Holliday junction ATP-dependent DNA helicase RuvA [Chlamydiia bacterium]|nr:Holliday junction ATP-dependent DNA helicase RuvA [Chlamydiia bacterium]MCH9616251.1 Holliday junction ATP-dependent DNA helicase RuvA [Chlamydiia bacterium]MCH9629763.1 Holliday junction ATP-dependent DNA helicase RuvA [Chlamydiia bacterium]